MVAASEVTTGDLQIASVEVALMERDVSVYCYLLGGAAPHVVVGTFDDGVAFCVGEAHGAVFGIVNHSPDTCGGFHQRLVAIGIEGGGEITHGGVLIQLISGIICGYVAFCCCFSIPDIVVVVDVVIAVDGGGGELAAVVVAEGVVLHRALARGVAGGGAPERVVAVLALCHESGAAMIRHACEQVALNLVALRQLHTIGLSERIKSNL